MIVRRKRLGRLAAAFAGTAALVTIGVRLALAVDDFTITGTAGITSPSNSGPFPVGSVFIASAHTGKAVRTNANGSTDTIGFYFKNGYNDPSTGSPVLVSYAGPDTDPNLAYQWEPWQNVTFQVDTYHISGYTFLGTPGGYTIWAKTNNTFDNSSEINLAYSSMGITMQ